MKDSTPPDAAFKCSIVLSGKFVGFACSWRRGPKIDYKIKIIKIILNTPMTTIVVNRRMCAVLTLSVIVAPLFLAY